MSFVNIEDINKRDEIVQKFLALKKDIRARDSAEIQAERGNVEALQKYFKPVTEGIAKITAAQPPTTKEEKNIFLNDPELNKYVNEAKKDPLIDLDLTGEQPKILLGNYPLNVGGDSIEYMGTNYKRTPELMNLIFSPNPTKVDKDSQAYKDFEKMMEDSGVLVVRSSTTGNLVNNPALGNYTKGNRWKRLLKYIAADLKTGSGLLDTAGNLIKLYAAKEKIAKKLHGGKHETVIIPSDPLALADRLSLVCGSIKAGNTGLKNEMVELCNALIGKKLMSRKERDQLLNSV